MRTRAITAVVVIINTLQFTFHFHKQIKLESIIKKAETSLETVKKGNEVMRLEIEEALHRHNVTSTRVSDQFKNVKKLLENSRKNFIRIKGVKEKTDENLEEKIVEMAMFLDIHLVPEDIERANRIGTKKKNGARVIVAQLSNHNLKQKFIRKASALSGMIEFSIQDDAASFVMPTPAVIREIKTPMKDCGYLQSVDKPILKSKSSTIFGAWLQDPITADVTKSPIWVLPHFMENRIVEEYATLRDLAHRRPHMTYELPYEWAGTGHVVYNGYLYYNKYNSSLLVKYSFSQRSAEVEKTLPDAAFANTAPYQWSGATDIDLAMDELGLWVIYATPDNALDIVISSLNVDNLEVLETWRTNWRKQWSGNAFMACGVLYVLKKYDEPDSSISFMYDTKTKTYKHADIPFKNLYEWNTMLSYNHKLKLLYAWDRGYLVNYNITFATKL